MAEEFILQCQLDQPAIPTRQPADLYSLVTVRPNISKIGALLESAEDVVLPAHLIVVVDVSGSMQILIENDPKAKIVGQSHSESGDLPLVESSIPSRRMVAQRVVQNLVERLSPDDRLTLVAFDQEAYPLANALPPGPTLATAVSQLSDVGGGGTSMGRALETVRNSLANRKVPHATQRIMVLTDGEDQEPTFAQGQAKAIGADYRIPIFAFGTGSSRGDFLLQMCAEFGGAYRDIKNEREAEDCFSEFLTRQKNILATNVSLQLWLSPEIFVRELYRTKPEVLFVGDMKPDSKNTVTIPIEYMEKNKAYEFLFRCNVPAKEAGRFRLAKATLLYDLPALGVSEQRTESNIVVEFTADSERAQIRLGEVKRVVGQAEVQRQLLFLQKKQDAIKDGRATEKDKIIVGRLLDELIKRFGDLGDQASANMYRNMKSDFLEKGIISQEMMNRSLAASSKVEGSVAVQEIEDF
jgi:Ca-activated chloride channel family protein